MAGRPAVLGRGRAQAYARHPWVLRVPISAPPGGPNNIRWLECALTCLGGTPLREQEKLSTVLLLSGFVRNESTLNADMVARHTAGPHAAAAYGTILARLADPLSFPSVHPAISSGALNDEEGMTSEFEFGLARIPDGVDVLMRTRRPGRTVDTGRP